MLKDLEEIAIYTTDIFTLKWEKYFVCVLLPCLCGAVLTLITEHFITAHSDEGVLQ